MKHTSATRRGKYSNIGLLHCQSALSHSVLASPLSGGGFIFGSVTLVDVGNLWHKRIIWVGVGQQGADGEQNLGDGECWRPLVLEDVQADGSVGVDVWVVDPGGEVDLGWLERIVSWEMNVQEVNTAGVGRLIGSHYSSLPVELIFLVDRTG